MLEQHVCAEITRRRLRRGIAANHVDEFADWLSGRDYKKRTVIRLLQSFAAWTEWLEKTGRSENSYSDGLESCEEYVRSLPRARYRFGPNHDSLRAARLFLHFLRERGLLSPKADSSVPADPLVREFHTWMVENRGVTKATLDAYRRVLDEFIETVGSNPFNYSPKVLRHFMLERAKRHGSSYARLGGTALRSFLRFLAATERCNPGLEFALPAYASRQRSSPPKFIAAHLVDRVIALCSTDSTGRRDKAILLLLARLGLRSGDIVRLQITDIDWSNGRIKVCGKGRRYDFLPLQQEVGTSVREYLERIRPRSQTPELFLTVFPPFRKLSYQAIGGIVRRALERAEVTSPTRGAHVLRHSAATTMLQKGASLASIGAVLRHRSPQTTARYAKVDIDVLSKIAQPWPGVTTCL